LEDGVTLSPNFDFTLFALENGFRKAIPEVDLCLLIGELTPSLGDRGDLGDIGDFGDLGERGDFGRFISPGTCSFRGVFFAEATALSFFLFFISLSPTRVRLFVSVSLRRRET